jgi:NADH:ubiquinone oxidoreductase subunit 2 (subunit N)
VSVYYHLRVVTAMYFREKQGGAAYSSWENAVILAVLAALALGLGIVPAPFMMLVQ